MKLLNFLILNRLRDRKPGLNLEDKIFTDTNNFQGALIGVTSPLLKVNSFGKIEKISF